MSSVNGIHINTKWGAMPVTQDKNDLSDEHQFPQLRRNLFSEGL